MQYTNPSHKFAYTSSTTMIHTWIMIILMQLSINCALFEIEQILTLCHCVYWFIGPVALLFYGTPCQ